MRASGINPKSQDSTSDDDDSDGQTTIKEQAMLSYLLRILSISSRNPKFIPRSWVRIHIIQTLMATANQMGILTSLMQR